MQFFSINSKTRIRIFFLIKKYINIFLRTGALLESLLKIPLLLAKKLDAAKNAQAHNIQNTYSCIKTKKVIKKIYILLIIINQENTLTNGRTVIQGFLKAPHAYNANKQPVIVSPRDETKLKHIPAVVLAKGDSLTVIKLITLNTCYPKKRNQQ